MTQSRLVMVYSCMMLAVSTLMGGYVACGAQTYRVPVHGEGGNDPSAPSNVKTSGDTQMNGANLLGIHSQAGWSRSGPILFYTSEEIPEAVVEHLRRAMATWEAAVGKQLFVYQGVEMRTGGDFESLYQPLDDQTNGHYFDYTWAQSTNKSASVLATTIWENSPTDVQSIVKADIRYNAEFYVFGDALNEFSEGKRTIVDMESLALHELGHLLGLSHVSAEDDKFSVMNPSLFIGEGMMTRNLSSQDITRIRQIYGVGDPAAADDLELADEQR
jgi:hypothetical protein